MKITSDINSEYLRIYFNGILHIAFPRYRMAVQSWYDGHKQRVYKIRIRSAKMEDEYWYESEDIWKNVLAIIDESLI